MSYPPSNFMFQTHDEDEANIPFQHFQPFLMKRSLSFSGVERCDELVVNGDDEYSDDGSQLGEKKKRLSIEQVKTLEKSFELGNKLDPERKLQLAKALGLQPRQIAIWFQNRRARWKTKQLEKDYMVLKKQFDALKADNDSLHSQNKKLQAEFLALKRDSNNEGIRTISLKKDAEVCWSNGSDNSCDINLDMRPSVSTQLSSKSVFPSSIKPAIPSTPDIQCQKIDQIVQDESFCCNMFGGFEDQPGIWPWPGQQQQQHFH